MTYGVDFACEVIFIRYIYFRHSSPDRTEFLLHLFAGYYCDYSLLFLAHQWHVIKWLAAPNC